MMVDIIDVELPVYDEDGNVVDTTTATLTSEQLNDLINSAVMVIYSTRNMDNDPTNKAFQEAMAVSLGDLEEVLETYNLIEEEKYVPGQSQG